MSMKRTKTASSSGRSRQDEAPVWGMKPARTYEWIADVASKDEDAFVTYSPANAFAVDALIDHRSFGIGIVTRVIDSKIEVLFETGPRTLGHDPRGAAPAKTDRVVPREVLRGVHWRFDQKSYESPDAFAAAVIAYHQKLGRPAQTLRFKPDAIAIRVAAIDVGFEYADRENACYEEDSVSLESADPTGFRQGELLWKIHQALSTRDLSDHCFFEGLTLADSSGARPFYGVLQGS